MIILFNCVRNCQFLPKLHHFILPSAECKDCNCPATSQLLILAILVGAEQYLVVVVSPWDFFPCVSSASMYCFPVCSMCSNVDWTQLTVLQKLLVLLFSMIYFSKCPAGTCDGCTFYFLWESVEACPLCTEHDFHEIEGACKRGFQVRGKLSKQNSVIEDTTVQSSITFTA